MTLKFKTLREANLARIPLFKNAQGEPAHTTQDGSDWTSDDWCMACLGELGEAANILKKVRRGDFTLEAARGLLAKELADVIIYLDHFARLNDVGLGDMRVRQSFYYVAPGGFNPSRPPAFLMVSALYYLGQAGIKAAVPTNRGLLSIYVGQAFELVEQVAQACGIDLGAAVTAKFNETSRKVGANVFIYSGAVYLGVLADPL